MVFTAIALVLLDWQSGLVLLVALVPLGILTRWFQVRSQALFRRSRVASAKLIVQFVETMTGIRAVKAFRKERRNEAEFGDLAEDYRDANAKVHPACSACSTPASRSSATSRVAVVLLVGGFRVVDGSLEVGVLLAARALHAAVLRPDGGDGDVLQLVPVGRRRRSRRSRACSRSSRACPTRRSRSTCGTRDGARAVRGVEFAYTSDRVVLPEFDLDIPAGQTIALVGSTGAGKSTLAKLIARFYDPSDGVVVARRRRPARPAPEGPAPRDRHGHAGGVPVLRLGRRQHRARQARRLVRRDRARPRRRSVRTSSSRRLPNGYDTDVNKRGGRVSAGQRQLISFARAFLADPAVLILDEATASLDIPSERLVQEGLTTLLADRTAVIIAHRLSTVAIADRVLVMEHGRIVEDGTPADLIGGTGRFAAAARGLARLARVTCG